VKTLLNQEKHCERQEVFSLFCLFVCLFVSWQYWGLKLRPHTCQVGTPPLGPQHQPLRSSVWWQCRQTEMTDAGRTQDKYKISLNRHYVLRVCLNIIFSSMCWKRYWFFK
jgi:hypothetical protein